MHDYLKARPVKALVDMNIQLGSSGFISYNFIPTRNSSEANMNIFMSLWKCSAWKNFRKMLILAFAGFPKLHIFSNLSPLCGLFYYADGIYLV